MAKIRQLDQVLINKIAAGEVVERPANVVKELVENSIDAQAKNIDIIIKEGGLTLIEVKDDGIGMDYDDAKLCFSTHATSKIADYQDLFNISTLGFRGEAIPSIASVSDFVLQTSDGSEHTFVHYHYGKLADIKKIERTRGTTISVANLFTNVPARLKFVKSVNVEYAHILQYIERLALTKPEISFSLTNNDRQVFLTTGNGNLLEIVANMYGINVARSMIEVAFGDEEFAIGGYTSTLDVNRANKNNIITLVNGRVVKNRIAIEAVDDAYRKYLFEKRYPIAVINIRVDPYLVDVNVHPAKLEVKFSKEEKLREIIFNGITEALKKMDITYQARNVDTKIPKTPLTIPANEQLELKLDFEPRKNDQLLGEPKKEYAVVAPEPQPLPAAAPEGPEVEIPEAQPVIKDVQILPAEPVASTVKARPIKRHLDVQGQVLGTYIVAQDEGGMYLIDQHAAKERINYEYFLERYANKNMAMMDMLVPLTFELPASDFVIVSDNLDKFAKIGIHFEEFSNRTFVVRSLPAWMKNTDHHVFIEEMIVQLLDNQSIDVLKLQDHAVATLACKASLKANTYLNHDGMSHLVNDLMRCDNPYVCPHGRPVIIYYTQYELEKLFKRVV